MGTIPQAKIVNTLSTKLSSSRMSREDVLAGLSDFDREVYDLITSKEGKNVFDIADKTGRSVAEVSESLSSLTRNRLLNIDPNTIEKYRNYTKVDGKWMSPEMVDRYNLISRDNVQLSTGEWVSRDKFEGLTTEQQSVLYSRGIEGFQEYMKTVQTESSAKSVKPIDLSPMKWDVVQKAYDKNLNGLVNQYYHNYYDWEGKTKGLTGQELENYVREEMQPSTFGLSDAESSAAHRPNIPQTVASSMIAEALAAAGGAEMYAQHRINEITNGQNMNGPHIYGTTNENVVQMVAQNGYKGLITGIFGSSNGYGLLQNGWLQAQLTSDFNTAQEANSSGKSITYNGQTVFIAPSGSGRSYTSGPQGQMNYVPAPGEEKAAQMAGWKSVNDIGYSAFGQQALGVNRYTPTIDIVNSNALNKGYISVAGRKDGIGASQSQFLAVPGMKDAYYANGQIVKDIDNQHYALIGKNNGLEVWQKIDRDGRFVDHPISGLDADHAVDLHSAESANAAISQANTLAQAAVDALSPNHSGSLISLMDNYSSKDTATEQQTLAYALSKDGMPAYFNDNGPNRAAWENATNNRVVNGIKYDTVREAMIALDEQVAASKMETELSFFYSNMSNKTIQTTVSKIVNSLKSEADKERDLNEFISHLNKDQKLVAENAMANPDAADHSNVIAYDIDGNIAYGIAGMNALVSGPGQLGAGPKALHYMQLGLTPAQAQRALIASGNEKGSGASAPSAPGSAPVAFMSNTSLDTATSATAANVLAHGSNLTAALQSNMDTMIAGNTGSGSLAYVGGPQTGVTQAMAFAESLGPAFNLGSKELGGVDASGNVVAGTVMSGPGAGGGFISGSPGGTMIATGFGSISAPASMNPGLTGLAGITGIGGAPSTTGPAGPGALGHADASNAAIGMVGQNVAGVAPGFSACNAGNDFGGGHFATPTTGGGAASGTGTGSGSGLASGSAGAASGSACGTSDGCCGGGGIGGIGASCPHIYSWDGREWHFDHDAYPFSIVKYSNIFSSEVLRHAKVVEGELRIQIREELLETSFVDSLEIYSLSYSDGMAMDVLSGGHCIFHNQISPFQCTSKNGQDCLELVNSNDDKFWMGSIHKDFKDANNHFDWIVADFNKPKDATRVKIGLATMSSGIITWAWDHWREENGENNFSLFESLMTFPPIRKDFISAQHRDWSLNVEIWDGKQWKVLGFVEVGKERWTDVAIVADIGDIKTDTLKIRFRSTSGWYMINNVFVDYSDDRKMTISKLNAKSIIKNDKEDVTSLLNIPNKTYLELNMGDTVDFVYDTDTQAKSYSARITGYYYHRSPICNRSLAYFILTQLKLSLPTLYGRNVTSQYLTTKFAKLKNHVDFMPIIAQDFYRRRFAA